MEGVVRPPSALGITLASPLSMIETHELVVPRSIPIVLLIVLYLLFVGYRVTPVVVYGQTLIPIFVVSNYLHYFFRFFIFVILREVKKLESAPQSGK
jgi:hypothetical protein